MAYNRNKSLAKAQKLLQKGKIEDAIQEYTIVVENDPSDIRTLLKIGDLHSKLGNIDAATDTYGRVGEYYAKDGFFLKAVAVFKQILKLDPGLIRIYVRLAELYQHLGLNSEAKKQYQIVVAHYETQGLKKDSLDILKKMSDLEPDNIASKLKLAELYAKEGHAEESVAQFNAVAADLKRKNNLQDLARVYEKMETVGILGDDQQLELVEVYLDTGEPKRALTALQAQFQKDPKNLKVLELLARAFTDLQQPEKAKSVYTEMVNFANEHGLLEERDRLMAKSRALGVISSAVPVVSGMPKAAAPQAKVSPPPQAGEPAAKPQKSAEKTLEEVQVFLQYGLLGKACDALSQAVVSMPGNEALRKKLVEAYRQVGDFQELDAVLKRSMAIASAQQLTDAVSAIQREIQLIGKWTDGGSPQGATVAGEGDLNVSPVGVVDASGAAPAATTDDLDVAFEDLVEGGEDEEVSGERTSMEPSPVAPDAPVSAADEKHPDESFDISFMDGELPSSLDFSKSAPGEADSGAELSPELVAEMELPEQKAGAKESPIPFDFDTDLSEAEVAKDVTSGKPKQETTFGKPSVKPEAMVVEPTPPVPPTPSAPEPIEMSPIVIEQIEPEIEPAPALVVEAEEKGGKNSAADGEFATDMEEAEFFISQGFLEEAQGVLQNVLAKAPGFEPAVRKLAELEAVRSKVPSVRSNLEPERRKAPREKSSVIPPAPEAPPVAKEPPRVLSESDAFFDLSEELQEEIRELETELVTAKSPDDEDYLSPEEVISEFKKGVARTISKDDYSTHYNLGIAYKEMGLLDEAISEFQVAKGDTDRVADCASMIGLCLMAKKDFGTAIGVYRKALAQVLPQSSEALGLSYELAEAYIGHGNLVEAYKLFARVADVDSTFRDCRRRAKELELDLGRSAPIPSGPEKSEEVEDKKDDEKSVVKIPGKKTKISYI